MTLLVHGRIHHFFTDPTTGITIADEDGDPMIGHYWQLVDADETAMSELMGPYNTDAEAVKACERAWQSGDY